MNKQVPITLTVIVFFLGFIYGCEDEHQSETVYNATKGVFICNEGNFTFGNATLSFFNTETSEIHNQVFYHANNFPLGDVCQSMAIADTFGYLVMNNSGKVLVISTNTFRHIHTISGLTSPRFIGLISPDKAYITDMYSPDITIINPTTYQVTGSVHIGMSTEQLVIHNNHAYVTGWSFNNKVYKIDCNIDQLVDSVTVGKQPNSIVLDKNQKLWVLSDGGYEGSPYGNEKPAITRIDAASFTVEQVFEFPDINNSPMMLCLNASKDILYYINGGCGSAGLNGSGIFSMPVTAASLPLDPFIPENSRMFYGLGFDREESVIYVSDAVDYTQNGYVFRYTVSGEKIDSFAVGISPGSFCFKY